MKIIYRAFDGEEFSEQHECIEYEMEQTSEVRESMDIIKNFCGMMDKCNEGCPFYNEECGCCQLEENPSNW